MRLSTRFSVMLGTVFAIAAVFAPAALATGEWRVESTNKTGVLKATSTKVTIDVNGSAFTCESAALEGSVSEGSGLSGEHIASITKTIFDEGKATCEGSFSMEEEVTMSGTEYINVEGTGASPSITVPSATITMKGALCSATLSGELHGVYENESNAIDFTNTHASLTASGVHGCLGAVKNGNTATFSGIYAVQGPAHLLISHGWEDSTKAKKAILPGMSAGSITFEDSVSGGIECAESAMGGKLVEGVSLPGEALWTIESLSFNKGLETCRDLTKEFSVSSLATMHFNAFAIKSGVTTGTITGVKLKLVEPVNSESAIATGTLEASYSNSTGKLTISEGSKLTVTEATLGRFWPVGSTVQLKGAVYSTTTGSELRIAL